MATRCRVDVHNDLIKLMVEAQHHGYAVVVWTPEELGELNPEDVEEIMIERGSEYINDSNVEDN